MKTLSLVVGARPNFMKAAPLMEELRVREWLQVVLVHTGQHFDDNMSDVFFRQLGLAEPDVYLDIHEGSPGEQVGRTILSLEELWSGQKPDMVVVFGDVNATLAAAVAANKMELPLAHVEAGLRSFDREMPEEHNRIVTDMLADLLFTPSRGADQNLKNEGIPSERIHFVGNIMVDSLLRFRGQAEALAVWENFGLEPREYGLVTLHRPGNVDEPDVLADIVEALVTMAGQTPLIFPVHPRTAQNLERMNLRTKLEGAGIYLPGPAGYLDFLSLMTRARFVLTDSGGIQEETTVLGVPCLTARENTERPITVEQGSNRLVGSSKEGILAGFEAVLDVQPAPRRPELWDGQTADRIATVLADYLDL